MPQIHNPESPGLPEPSLPEDTRSQRRDPQPDPDLDAVWRVAIGLDSEDMNVLEAEVLLWRICSAKSIPEATIRRAICEEWKFDG